MKFFNERKVQRSVDFIYKGFFKNTLMRTEKIRVLKEHRNVLKCWQMFSRTPSWPFINSSRNKCSSRTPKCSQVLANVFANTYMMIYIQLKKGVFLQNTKMFGSVRKSFSQTLTLRIIISILKKCFCRTPKCSRLFISVLDCS